MVLNRVDERTEGSMVLEANCYAGEVDYLFRPITQGAIENFQWYNNHPISK